VLTNNFSAEYGLGSGIINITPRSGSNETTGEVFFTRPGPSIDGNPALHRETYQETSQEWFCSLPAGAGIGGALVKNKTFIISTLNTTDIKDNLLNVPQLGITETVRA
jgi:hypothetical protein